MPESVFLHLVWNRWARTNETHVPFQNIEKLWKLVQTGFSQNAAKVCNPGIVIHLVKRLCRCATIDLAILPVNEVDNIAFVNVLVSIGDHGSEFEKGKPPPQKANSLLTKEDGTGRS